VADGRTNFQVAAQLGISAATVRTHLENAFPKLGVSNRTAAAAALRGHASDERRIEPGPRAR
jgi:DNA-binding CsgD family transcriptional regulator